MDRDKDAVSARGNVPQPSRLPWLAPQLTRHASLVALTLQQFVDPATGRLVQPNPNAENVAQIPGSGGFFI